MNFDLALSNLFQLQHQAGNYLDGGLLIFVRTLAFLFACPIFNRKDVAFIVKLSLSLFLTVMFIWMIPLQAPADTQTVSHPVTGIFLLQITTNILIGLFIGFIGNMIHKTISAAGSMMNNQIGLSSAMVLDPSSRQQVMVLDPLFGLLATIIFIHLGGIHWLVMALQRSFEVFPLYTIQQPFSEVVDMDYLVKVSANVILMATIMVAPVIVVTMSVDIILGIVNRAAQQMPVFQLSFALKPCIGVSVLLITLPILIPTIIHFFEDYAQIF